MEEEFTGQNKRSNVTGTSTPIWRQRAPVIVSPGEVSPIKIESGRNFSSGSCGRNISNGSCGWNISDGSRGHNISNGSRGRGISYDELTGLTNDTAGERILAAGLSPELKRLLIRPRSVDEFEDTRKLLIETINLTRAARSFGIIKGSNSMPDIALRLEENTFFIQVPYPRSCSISEMMRGINLNDWEEMENVTGVSEKDVSEGADMEVIFIESVTEATNDHIQAISDDILRN